MRELIIKLVGIVALLLSLIPADAFAQDDRAPGVVHYAEQQNVAAPDVIFSNLDPEPGNRFDSDPSSAFPVTGVSALSGTEVWDAISFSPKVDTRAQV